MAIRIRRIKNEKAIGGFSYIALCAAKSKSEEGDIYLDDGMHHALHRKFWDDFSLEEK